MQTTDILFLAIFIAILLVLYFNLRVNIELRNMVGYMLFKHLKEEGVLIDSNQNSSSVVENNFKVLTR